MGNIFDPVEASKNRWDLSGYSDPQLYHHLSDPAKFRQTFPEYGDMSDEEIAQGMQRTALSNPQYGAYPDVSIRPNPALYSPWPFGGSPNQRLRALADPIAPEQLGLLTGPISRGKER